MPWNGSGIFNPLYYFVQDAANGIKILASRQDAMWADTDTNGFGNTITRDGQGAASANQPMNGFIHVGVGSASLADQYVPVGQLQSGVFIFDVAGGTADVITSVGSPALTALTNGMLVQINATAANATTTPTFNPDALGANTITRLGGNALSVGDIYGVGHRLLLSYSLTGPRWELLNPAQPIVVTGTFTPTDASGASLTLASPVGFYRKMPGFVHIWGSFSYPSTADGSNAKIGGLPFTSANLGITNGFQGIVQFGGGGGVPGGAAPNWLDVIKNSTTMEFRSGGSGALTNANLSTSGVYFTATYPI